MSSSTSTSPSFESACTDAVRKLAASYQSFSRLLIDLMRIADVGDIKYAMHDVTYCKKHAKLVMNEALMNMDMELDVRKEECDVCYKPSEPEVEPLLARPVHGEFDLSLAETRERWQVFFNGKHERYEFKPYKEREEWMRYTAAAFERSNLRRARIVLHLQAERGTPPDSDLLEHDDPILLYINDMRERYRSMPGVPQHMNYGKRMCDIHTESRGELMVCGPLDMYKDCGLCKKKQARERVKATRDKVDVSGIKVKHVTNSAKEGE